MSHPSSTTKPAPRKPGRWLALLLPPLLGAAAGYLIARFAISPPFVREQLSALNAWDLLGLPLAVLVVIAVHEAGHLIGGLSRGMSFLLYVVGPFQFSRSSRGIRFNWVFNMGTFGGLAACLPDPDRPLRPQLMSLVAGGPLASLLLAAVALLPALGFEGRVAAWSLIIALLSSLIFAVTAFPMRSGGFMSDGAQFLEVRRGGPAVAARQRLCVLMGQSLAGVRPAHWDARLIAEALQDEDPEPLRRVAARHMAYLHALDAGDAERASELAAELAEHIEDYPAGFRQAIAVELVIHHALERGDRESAAAWAALARSGVVDPGRRALADAALAEDPDRRLQALEAARVTLSRSGDPGLGQLTARQIAQLAERAVQM